MEISLNAVILKPAHFPKLNATNRNSVKSPLPCYFCCSRKNEEAAANGLFKAPSSKLEVASNDNVGMYQEKISPSNFELEAKNNDIWKLFKEAQQNILYLNKQRLLAVGELSNANREKELLLDKIEQLEAEKQAADIGKDKQSVCCELLLRIDSMVLMGMITASEASNLRNAVMDYKFSVADLLFDNEQKSDTELLAELRQFSHGSKKTSLHIVHICTEMAPVAEVGSLASYVTGLSLALQKKGHLAEVILPKYANLNLSEIHGLREIQAESYSYYDGQLHGNKIWTGVVNGIGVTFIQPLYYSSFFNREKIYGYTDDFERFSYFSRASLDYLTKSGKQPDVLHIHNWETAIIGPLFWDVFAKQGLEGTRILLTCHGLDSQCLEKPDKLALCGLDPGRLHRPDRLQDNAKTQFVNILKGGVVYSNKVVIVSSIHSKGRFIDHMSHGLGPALSIHQDKLVVTPYGFDKSTWDPSKDRFLPENYSEDDMKGKSVCKGALQQYVGLSKNTSAVLVGCIISELTDFDVNNLKAVVKNADRNTVQFVFIGSEILSANRALESLQKELKGENVRFINKYDEAISHLIFSGSNIILCQSFHDPLLQVPLKALKYGAAPIALTSNDNRFRNSDFVDRDQEIPKFAKFISSTFESMSLSEAVDEIKNNQSKWKQKIAYAMAMDFSWDADCYDIHVSAYSSLKNL
ncbi:probable starch synthase 4, chloroplastic/amyloplastic [Mercurialis annua]|uniref:probable starch synthase 4, chloroplastic/amyloplastic n=1 Tax=Mercurialis annua TaxID=3986 RepID=UPI00215F9BDF|nr:probable starch synthase 4, chloroplastic/amyloplastic [Mercurialis annua]XP_050205430.1 probable starch synthase 4, chloroplastic/amyloplastic [Mercurialis annua]